MLGTDVHYWDTEFKLENTTPNTLVLDQLIRQHCLIPHVYFSFSEALWTRDEFTGYSNISMSKALPSHPLYCSYLFINRIMFSVQNRQPERPDLSSFRTNNPVNVSVSVTCYLPFVFTFSPRSTRTISRIAKEHLCFFLSNYLLQRSLWNWQKLYQPEPFLFALF